MSIAESLIRIVKSELAVHGLRTVQRVKIRHGALSTMVPEALEFAFEIMTKNTPLEGAVLEFEKIPLSMSCSACKAVFSPEIYNLHFAPCPICGEEFGHTILTGKELHIEHIEGDT
jgi:hydrogenase nickel incorporation protein HypA/HybF